MALYSRWRADSGLYDYFESDERIGLGDDLSMPQLQDATELGVPSTEAGRQPRGRLRPAGRGERARGSILPLDRTGLQLASDEPLFSNLHPAVWFVGGAGSMLVLYLLLRRRR